jgi:predicted ATPase
MLRRLHIKDFKSLKDIEVELPRFAVLFGPNSSGKSNFLDALQALSRAGTLRTLSDALAEPIRGYAIESFSFPPGGLQALLGEESASFEIEADVSVKKEAFRYRFRSDIEPGSGRLGISDEYLAQLGSTGQAKGKPSIERVGNQLYIRRKSKPAHPRQESVGLNHTILSDPRLGGVEYRAIERVREELSGWRTYYLDPRVAMRKAQPPSDVRDIGVLGGEVAPFLYRLRAENQKAYDAVSRTLRSIIPSIEDMTVDLDKRRGTLDITIRQDGIDYSSRVASEGTLRVLALCSIAVNPWGGSLLAFEEPENGVHPRRIELIAKLLHSLATEQERQVIVTTHSPLFCDAVLELAGGQKDAVGLFNVQRLGQATSIKPFPAPGRLFDRHAIERELDTGSEDGVFGRLMLRGMIDD